MSATLARSRPRIRPSVSRRDLIPELGIAAATVAATTVVHLLIVVRLGDNSPLFLFAATAAALTFWRGLGPGMVASSLGSAVGPYSVPFNDVARLRGNLPVETLLLWAGSMFTCWLIYRLRVEQEDFQAIQRRRDAALAFVSHELRQPLSNIMLIAGILERNPSEETRNGATSMILRSATRLATVVDDLVDVTQLDANAIRIDPSVVCLQDSLLAAISSARPAIDQKRQHLETDLALDQPLLINADMLRLEQVFGNLLSNACKYSPAGATISISLHEEQGRAVIAVRDTGVGIKREMLEAIFDPFVRESRGVDGLGIGLTLARNLVTQHGGQIVAHSEGRGRGSMFVIDLPLLALTPDEVV
jgi:signal transduction histidine kinase